MKIAFISLGCPKNSVDTEHFVNLVDKTHFVPVSEPQKADIIIINTCGFIEPALLETKNTIKEMLKIRKTKPALRIYAMGCAVSRQSSLLKEVFSKIDGIYSLGEEKKLLTELNKNHATKIKPLKPSRQTRTTLPHYAYLKIAEGCNRFCTYCTIPQIRGDYHSKPLKELIQEAKFLVQNGVKELILIAQDTTYYGVDTNNKPQLLDLLKELALIKKLKWIRVLYAYPEFIEKALLDFFLESPKVINYLDLPIQHSFPDLLKQMGRKNTFSSFNRVFEILRENDPDFALRTSIITGFPGETKEAFEHLRAYISKTRFDRLGVFRFYPEKGTPAFAYKNQISKDTTKKRYETLMISQQKIHFEKNEAWRGRKIQAIVDYVLDNNLYLGRTFRDAPEIDTVIEIESKKPLFPGDVLTVSVIESKGYDLAGRA